MNPLIIQTSNEFDSPVIVALDYTSEAEVMNLIEKLSPDLCKLKVGKELFTSCGPKLVEKLVVSGYKVFLDLKFHDIPNTVYKACKAAANLGVWMTNVHASGGSKMLELAKQGVDEVGNNTLLIAVTVLTSMNQNDLYEIGIHENINTHIHKLAELTHRSGLDGVVCSAHEAAQIKQLTTDSFITTCPGIRLSNEISDDQQRIMTPAKALANKADYLVIGRPITQATDPYDTLLNINASISKKKILSDI